MGQALYDAVNRRSNDLITGAKIFWNVMNNPIHIPGRTTLKTKSREFKSSAFDDFVLILIKRQEKTNNETGNNEAENNKADNNEAENNEAENNEAKNNDETVPYHMSDTRCHPA